MILSSIFGWIVFLQQIPQITFSLRKRFPNINVVGDGWKLVCELGNMLIVNLANYFCDEIKLSISSANRLHHVCDIGNGVYPKCSNLGVLKVDKLRQVLHLPFQ